MSSKFVTGDPVRVTNPNLQEFDRVGVVTGYAEIACEPASQVQLDGIDFSVPFKQSSLTLADSDVHTVLDQMDAESLVVTVGADTDNSFTMRITDPEHPAFKDITEQEIDGEYVRGLAGQLGVKEVDAEDFTRNIQQLTEPDPVNHPQHYGGDTTYEVIKVAEAWGLDKDAYLFNVLKYVARAGKKGDVLEDLEKGDFYLNRRIATIKAAQ